MIPNLSRCRSRKFPVEPVSSNLLVFLPDELRADLIIGDGAKGVHAPALRRLASESVVFEHAYVTHPICSPSRSSLLSGTWPHQTGCTDNASVLPLKFRCLPEMLGDSTDRGRKKKGQSDYTEFLLSKGYKPDLHNGQSFDL